MSEDRPTDLHLQLADQNPLEGLERLKINTLLRLCLIVVFTLTGKNLFERCDMVPLQPLSEDLTLKLDKLFIIQVPITVSVEHPKNPLQSFLKLGLEGLAQRVPKGSYRVQYSLLGAC